MGCVMNDVMILLALVGLIIGVSSLVVAIVGLMIVFVQRKEKGP